jgi:regulator of sigma E protease
VDGYGIVFRRLSETRRVPGILNAIGAGLRRSLQTASNILRTIGGIFSGRVSAKNLGGPIMIFEVSYQHAERNFVHFLYFLAILSVNLAILNVLPIPVLDGGHLMFLAIEAIRRKPLSERAMGMAQWVGLLLLLMLMAFVIVNDVGRHL